MICAWKELLGILPPRLRSGVDKLGRESMQELRLRLGGPPEIVTARGSVWLEEAVAQADVDYVINAASRYSPWAAATAAQGYLTSAGGHRIGLCGEAVYREGRMEGIRRVTGLCIRVARDFQGIGRKAAAAGGSILILGAPGWGKTTLLRDVIRYVGEKNQVSVVDERRELFPEQFSRGKRVDILWGCPKSTGIEIMLRTMGPKYIAVDEITAGEDCNALIRASNCGVNFLATAHGASLRDFQCRSVYRPLVECGIFRTVLLMREDKTYTLERMGT